MSEHGEHGSKNDTEKTPLELLPTLPLWQIADVLAFGAKKYERWNWRRGLRWSRLYGAALRHLTAWADGEDLDEESGLHHVAHAACCLVFLLEMLERPELDDRWKEAK